MTTIRRHTHRAARCACRPVPRVMFDPLTGIFSHAYTCEFCGAAMEAPRPDADDTSEREEVCALIEQEKRERVIIRGCLTTLGTALLAVLLALGVQWLARYWVVWETKW